VGLPAASAGAGLGPGWRRLLLPCLAALALPARAPRFDTPR
jgi:hypothetical protein